MTGLKDEILKFVEDNCNNKSSKLEIDVNIPLKKVIISRMVKEEKKEL